MPSLTSPLHGPALPCAPPNCIEHALPGEAAWLSRIRAFDWSLNVLGQPGSWSQSLCNALGLCATARVPMLLCWGPASILFYNDAHAACIGRTRQVGSLGRPLRDAWPDLGALIGPLIEEVQSSGQAVESDDIAWRGGRASAREVCLRFSFSPVLEDDHVAGVLGVCHDVTDARVAARRLETVTRLHARLKGCDDASQLAQAACDALEKNSQDLPFAALYLADGEAEAELRAHYGLPAAHTLPLVIDGARDAGARERAPFSDAGARERAPGWPLSKVLATREVQLVQLPLCANGGPEAPMQTLVVPCGGQLADRCRALLVVGLGPSRALDPPLRAFIESVAQPIGAALALAQARARERQLIAEREAAVRASEVKSRFLTVTGHDLRQPLQTILLLESVLSRALHDSDLTADVELLGEAARTMDEQLAGLLEWSRLEAGAVVPRLGECSLHELLGKLRDELGPRATRRALSLSIDDTEERVRSDPALLALVLRHLVGCALEHAKQDRISVRVRPAADHVHVEIAGGGLRFSPGPLESALEDACQSQDARRGVGLALAIVQRLAQLLGHEIKLENPSGPESMFCVRLPRAATARESSVERVQPSRGAAAEPALTLLHIEDDPAISRLLASILRFQGYRVVSATSREEALHRIDVQQVRPDLIVTDYLLPSEATGDEVVAEIATRLGSRPPTILLTGDITSEHRQRIARTVDRILSKPVEIELLLSELASLSPRPITRH